MAHLIRNLRYISLLALTVTSNSYSEQKVSIESFAGEQIQLTPVENHCKVVKRNNIESEFFDKVRELQQEAGNKLLDIWVDCPGHERIMNGARPKLNFWFQRFATLSKGEERLMPDDVAAQYINIVQEQWRSNDDFLEKIVDLVEKISEEHEVEMNLSNPISLGATLESNILYYGMIINADSQPILGVMATTVLRGIPVTNAFYIYVSKVESVDTFIQYVKSHMRRYVALNTKLNK